MHPSIQVTHIPLIGVTDSSVRFFAKVAADLFGFDKLIYFSLLFFNYFLFTFFLFFSSSSFSFKQAAQGFRYHWMSPCLLTHGGEKLRHPLQRVVGGSGS